MSYPHNMYICTNCKEEWMFCPEDYENIDDYPTVCPHCTMPVWELVKNTYEEGGLSDVLYWLRKRYL